MTVDHDHLRRCITLAEQAVERGDEPFGSILVDGAGNVLAERSNRVVTDDDRTAHPELSLAVWAARQLDDATRAGATMYTSGEHCAMCAAAHVWAGIGGLKYVLSSEMIAELADAPISIGLGIRDMVAASNFHVEVDGPFPDLVDEAAALFNPLRSATT